MKAFAFNNHRNLLTKRAQNYILKNVASDAIFVYKKTYSQKSFLPVYGLKKTWEYHVGYFGKIYTK